MRTGLLIGAFSLISAVAAAGWMRNPSPRVDAYPQQFGFQPVGYSGQSQPGYAGNPAAGCVQDGYVGNGYATNGSPVYTQYPAQPAVRRVYSSSPYAVRSSGVSTRYVKQPRSTKKSVAIVAASSGVGAAIGALVGGGRGAAIGALAGGGGGFVYDRLTHRGTLE